MSATRASCRAGWYCVWEHSNFRGAMAQWSTTKAHCKKFKFTDYWKNKVSSFRARGGCELGNYFLKDAKRTSPTPSSPSREARRTSATTTATTTRPRDCEVTVPVARPG